MTAVQKISAWGVLFVLFMWGVFELRDILLPFVAGMCIAYFLDPVTTKLQKYFHSRMAALIVVSAILILLALMFIFVLVPVIQKQLAAFIANFPVYAALLWDKVEPFLTEMKRLFPDQMQNLHDTIQEHLSGSLKILLKTVQRILSGSMAVINLMSLLLVTPIVAFYLLRDWPKFCAIMRSLLPREEAQTIRCLLSQINDTIRGLFADRRRFACFWAFSMRSV